MPGTPTPNHGIPTMAGSIDAGSTIDDTYNSGVAVIDGKLTKIFEISKDFGFMGQVIVPVGNSDVLPAPFVPVKAGTTVKLVRCRYAIHAGTSATFKVQRNGVDAAGFVGLVATTTPAEADPADITLTHNDRLQVVVTAVSGTPVNLNVSLVLEVTV